MRSIKHYRPSWAVILLTTSTGSDGPGRLTSKRKAITATDAKNVGQFYVRNSNGDPVPLDALATIKNITGPEFTLRFNEYRSAQINGVAAPGYSSTQAMKASEETFQQTMPKEMGYDYMGMSFQEKKAQQGVSPTACSDCRSSLSS